MKYPLKSNTKDVPFAKQFEQGKWYKCITGHSACFYEGYVYLACKDREGKIRLVNNGGTLTTPVHSKFILEE